MSQSEKPAPGAPTTNDKKPARFFSRRKKRQEGIKEGEEGGVDSDASTEIDAAPSKRVVPVGFTELFRYVPCPLGWVLTIRADRITYSTASPLALSWCWTSWVSLQRLARGRLRYVEASHSSEFVWLMKNNKFLGVATDDFDLREPRAIVREFRDNALRSQGRRYGGPSTLTSLCSSLPSRRRKRRFKIGIHR